MRTYNILRDIAARRDQAVGMLMELLIKEIYTQLLSPGDSAIDGGAHSGLHTFPMAGIVGRNGRVYAFEAIPSFGRDLAIAAASRSPENISVYAFALARTSGESTFVIYPEKPGYSGLLQRPAVPDHAGAPTAITVATVAIDDIIPKSAEVKFIKLDLEGGELDCLSGAAGTIERCQPTIVFEHTIRNTKQYGHTKEEFFGYFERVGYQVVDFSGTPFRPADWEEPSSPYMIAIPLHNAELQAELNSIWAKFCS